MLDAGIIMSILVHYCLLHTNLSGSIVAYWLIDVNFLST